MLFRVLVVVVCEKGILLRLVKVIICISVFFSLWMLLVICWVMSLSIFCGMVMWFCLVFIFRIVMWVLYLGDWMLVISFYLKWFCRWFLSVWMFLGGWFELRMICLLFL